MTAMLADALPGRDIQAVADAACAGKELRKLSSQVSWTTRLRKDAAPHDLPPARTDAPEPAYRVVALRFSPGIFSQSPPVPRPHSRGAEAAEGRNPPRRHQRGERRKR